jgi:hypothetical protein
MCARGKNMGVTSCDCQSTLMPTESGPDTRSADEADSWAYIWLPVEILEIVWSQIPLHVRALLSKHYYIEWCTEQIAGIGSRRDRLNLGRWIRRQVRMNHVYTFSVLLDLQSRNWSKMRPWRIDSDKYASFLWYLEGVCAQLDRHEMRSLVRHAIDRHEGSSKSTGKKRNKREQRSHCRMGGIRRDEWSSFA